MATYCENCELTYNEKTSDTGKCPLCTKSANSYLKKPKYVRGNKKRASVKSSVNFLLKTKSMKSEFDFSGNNLGVGKRKVGK